MLQTSPLINIELPSLVHGGTETAIVLPRIDVIGIVLGIVNMLLRPVATESIPRDLELASSIPERHETEHPEQKSNGFSADILNRAYVDSLAVISQPIPEV
jgi:hypothetical protein